MDSEYNCSGLASVYGDSGTERDSRGADRCGSNHAQEVKFMQYRRFQMSFCSQCDARWADGEFNEDCCECGGGALECACPICNGQCGSRWVRAIEDSHLEKVAHWYGCCALPLEQQQQLLQARQDSPVCI